MIFIAGILCGIVIGVIGTSAVVWAVAGAVMHLVDAAEGEALL